MKKYSGINFFHKKIGCFFALVLFLATALHTIYFDHDHQKEIFGDGMQAIMHGSDKKHFFVLDAPNLYSPSFTFLPERFLFSYFFLLFSVLVYKGFDPFREALRRGKIHPKLYA